ncbi:hypothetical protein OROHE_018752 [Orobanche hederae]
MKAYMLEVNAHTEPCRALCFVNEAIVTGSPDCSILATDVETGVQIARMENSHGAAVNRIVNLTESTIASGDGEGCIKVRDTRQRSCCNSFSVREEYISDMTFASDSMKLIGTSGDRTLSVCNSGSNKVQSRSEFSEDELLSVVIMTISLAYVGPTTGDVMFEIMVFMTPIWLNFAMRFMTLLSLSKLENEKSRVVNENDLRHLHTLVEEKDDGPSWIQMMDRSTSGMKYQAWRRDPENGPPQYRSRSVDEDATPEMFRDFSGMTRLDQKGTICLYMLRLWSNSPLTGTAVVEWVRKVAVKCQPLTERERGRDIVRVHNDKV